MLMRCRAHCSDLESIIRLVNLSCRLSISKSHGLQPCIGVVMAT